jgi:ABC-type multidrug transport system fused ATPase/permease subunit
MNTWFILYCICLLIIIIAIIISSYLNKREKKKQQEQEELLFEIEDLIILRTKELNEIIQNIERMQVNNKIGLTEQEIKVLDIYDKSNIRIPADIIEDLHNMKLKNEKDILDYIENQRHFWKWENTKKPFKGGEKDE